MKQFNALFSVLCKEFFRVRKGQKGNGKKGMSTWATYLILGVVFLPLLILTAIGLFLLGKVNASLAAETASSVVENFATVLLTAVQLVALFFGIPAILGNLYFASDSEIVLNLPMKAGTVFAAKLTVAYLVEEITTGILLLFTLLPYGIGAGAPLAFYLSFLPAVVLIPVLPLLLATILAIPFMYLVSFFRRKATLSSIMLILLFVVIFGGYMMVVVNLGNFIEAGSPEELMRQFAEMAQTFAKTVYPNFIMAQFLFATTFVSFLLPFALTLGIEAALFALIYLIANAVYRRSLSKQLETPKQSKASKEFAFRQAGLTKELVQKDLKTILRTPALALNCLLQLVFVPIFAAVFVFSGGFEESIVGEGLSFFVGCCLASMLIWMNSSTNVAANGAFTREGENVAILKSLPIDVTTIVSAKVILGVCLNEISLLLAAIIFAVAGYGGEVLLFLVVLGTTFGCGGVYLSVYCDMRKPRLNWLTVQQGLKNNFSSLVSLVAFLIVTAILVGGSVLTAYVKATTGIQYLEIVYFSLTFVLSVAFLFTARALLKKHCAEYFERM